MTYAERIGLWIASTLKMCEDNDDFLFDLARLLSDYVNHKTAFIVVDEDEEKIEVHTYKHGKLVEFDLDNNNTNMVNKLQTLMCSVGKYEVRVVISPKGGSQWRDLMKAMLHG